MAGIDKTYANNWDRYEEYFNWAKKQDEQFFSIYKVNLSDYFYKLTKEEFTEWVNEVKNNTIPICNTSTCADVFLIRNCPFDWVQERLKEQYGDEYVGIKNYTSGYDTYQRNGLGKNVKFTVKYPKVYTFNNFTRYKGVCSVWINCDNIDWWYNEDVDMWYNSNELFPTASNTAYSVDKNTAYHKKRGVSIKAILNRMRKWNLPSGLTFNVSSKYSLETIKIITK